jgi:hypothetical protein
MTAPLMPKATAVWLIENTSLTFEQISSFCDLHIFEVQAIADGEAAFGIMGMDPVAATQITMDEIRRCEADANARLELTKTVQVKTKSQTRYTPLAKRHDRPDAIAWIIKNHPDMDDATICKLMGTTKHTLNSIKSKSHWNAQQIRPRHPVNLGLCTQTDLENAILKIKKKSSVDG